MARQQKSIGIQSTVDVADAEVQAGGVRSRTIEVSLSSTSASSPTNQDIASAIVPPSLSQQEKIDYSDGYGLYSTQRLLDMIATVSSHSAECGGTIECHEMNFKEGAGIKFIMVSSTCSEQFTFTNCQTIKTDQVEPGRKFSRPQCELNVRIPKAARESGVNFYQCKEFLAKIGVKICNYRNFLHCEKKIRLVIEDLSESRLQENLREHAQACRDVPGYLGDIIWVDELNITHRAARGPLCMDGAGLTRSYNHRMKGSQAALIVISLLTGKPLMLIHTQVSRNDCSLQTAAAHLKHVTRSNVLSALERTTKQIGVELRKCSLTEARLSHTLESATGPAVIALLYLKSILQHKQRGYSSWTTRDTSEMMITCALVMKCAQIMTRGAQITSSESKT